MFKIGDKVRCVDDSPGKHCNIGGLKVGNDYVVMDIVERDGRPYIGIVDERGMHGFWYSSRFVLGRFSSTSETTQQLCCCSMETIMISGCKCGGK